MKPLFKKGIWLLVLSFVFLIPNFLPYHLVDLAHEKLEWETYEPVLAQRIRSTDDVLRFTDSLTTAQNVKPGTLEYGIVLNRVIKWRFYHGYSHYALNENWIAALSGKFIWDDLSAIVIPDDILKYPMAACSQQSIVLMECLRRKGIPFRKAGFDHHFVVEANFDGWYYFDPDMEPDWNKTPRGSLKFLLSENLLPTIYRRSLDVNQIQAKLVNPHYGAVNAAPAPNAALFHKITKIGSRILWLFPLSFYLVLLGRRKELKPVFRMMPQRELSTY